jgi:hypothetical protein
MARANILVATSQHEADYLKQRLDHYRFHVVLTPYDELPGFQVAGYVWTPAAQKLPAATRLRLKGLLAPLIDEDSFEEEFDEDTLLSW